MVHQTTATSSHGGHRWIRAVPVPAAMHVAEVDRVGSLGDGDLRDGFAKRMLTVFDEAIAAGIEGPIGVVVAVYPARASDER